MIIYRNINGIDFAVNPQKSAGLLCEQEVADKTHGSIYSFIDFLYNEKQKYTPMVTTWEITSICNFSCKFCYIHSEKNTNKVAISLEKAKEVIDDLVDAGLLLVYLTGGEVFSHPNFKDIYLYLKNKGVFIVLLTNISLLNNDILELLKEYPPLRVTASIYGITDTQFQNVTQCKNISAKTVLNNILLLKDNGINITVQTPINKITFPEYKDIAEWCYSNGIVYKSDNDLTNSYVGESRQEYSLDDELFKKTKESLKFIVEDNDIIDNTTKPKCDFGHRYHFDCISGKHTYALSYNLHLRPCFNIWENAGPWFDGSVSMKAALAEMTEYLENKKKEIIPMCKGCTAHEFCSECMMTQNKHIDDLSEYMKEACINAFNKAKEYKQINTVE